MPRCPGCSTALTRVEEAGIKMHGCSGCFGTWIAYPALLRLLRTVALPAEVASASLTDLAALVTESDTKKPLHCPECGAPSVPMIKDRVNPLIPVTLDRCPRCKAMWFDAGELPLVRRLFWELQHTEDPRIKALQEKIAMANLGMDQRKAALQNLGAPSNGGLPGGVSGLALGSLINMLGR